jgi:hypothetical protein
MRGSTLGTFLLTVGLLVGVAAGVALTLGFDPTQLPPQLVKVALYKITFLAAGGLIAAGAIVRRESRASRSPGDAAAARGPAERP